jgi:multidrug resistance efflux pump
MRDWSADKRQAEIRVRQASVNIEHDEAEIGRIQAQTREINARASKAELETELLRRFAAQTNRVDALVEAGVTPRELQAVAQLTSADMAVEFTEDETDA